MLSWAIIFFIVALIAGALGFFSLAGAAAVIAKVCFFNLSGRISRFPRNGISGSTARVTRASRPRSPNVKMSNGYSR